MKLPAQGQFRFRSSLPSILQGTETSQSVNNSSYIHIILGSHQIFFDSFATRGACGRRLKNYGTDAAWAKYRELSNCVRYATHCSHREYLQELGASLQTNPKRFWSYVSCRNTPNNVLALKMGNQLLSEDQDKAEALNRHFQRVFTNEPPMDSLPAPSHVPDAILDNFEFSSEEVRRELE